MNTWPLLYLSLQSLSLPQLRLPWDHLQRYKKPHKTSPHQLSISLTLVTLVWPKWYSSSSPNLLQSGLRLTFFPWHLRVSLKRHLFKDPKTYLWNLFLLVTQYSWVTTRTGILTVRLLLQYLHPFHTYTYLRLTYIFHNTYTLLRHLLIVHFNHPGILL